MEQSFISLLMQLLLSFDYDSHYLILLLLLYHSNRSIYFYLSIDAKNKLLKVSLIAQTKLSFYSSLAIAIHNFQAAISYQAMQMFIGFHVRSKRMQHF